MGLVITFSLGLFVLIGAAIAGFSKNGARIREVSIAIALGAMVMLLVCDLFPEAIEEVDEIGWPLAAFGVICGISVLVVLDRFLPEAHASHESHNHSHGFTHGDADLKKDALHISIATTVALVVHNVIEGMSVCGVAFESATLALLLGLGVGVHNVPMGMIVYSGVRNESLRRRIVILALASLSTFLGGIIMFSLGDVIDERFVTFMICVTIGLLLYIVVAELAAHVIHSDNKPLSAAFVIIGAAIVYASGFIEALA